MENQNLLKKSLSWLETLCVSIPERPVGSEGNRTATDFFRNELVVMGWETKTKEFDAIDWITGGTTLRINNTEFEAQASPYSNGCEIIGQLAAVSNIAELENGIYKDKIILLHGEIAQEQLMPKNFVFYNPESHQKIVSLLENSGAKALICATGRNAALAGGVYPFPLIEDGDFDIPSVFMTEEEGKKLLAFKGMEVMLHSIAQRIPGKGFNVTGKKGLHNDSRIVVTAHIDAKKGSPGAIDNATGVVILLLLADMLKDYTGDKQIEIVAFNGEDYFSVPGQMAYIMENQGNFKDVFLNINIDGAGFMKGKSCFSFFDLPEDILSKAKKVLNENPEITEAPQWPQGDHSIFVQYGRPAIAVSSQWFIENIDSQDITHTPKDNIDIVDCSKLVKIADALNELIREL